MTVVASWLSVSSNNLSLAGDIYLALYFSEMCVNIPIKLGNFVHFQLLSGKLRKIDQRKTLIVKRKLTIEVKVSKKENT